MYSFYAIIFATLAGMISLINAAPLSTRSVDNSTFSELQLFSQYAAAAYCPNNADNTNTSTPITCPNSNNCPLLEFPNEQPITSVWEFQHSTWTDVTGYIALDPNRNLTVLAFRGSHTFKNWLANLDAGLALTDLCPGCKAWHGFWLSWQEARPGILAAFKQTAADHPGYRTVVVGHSLGGAIADLAAADLRNSGTAIDLFTYGAPRIGGQEISDYITNTPPQNGSTYRVTHADDPVPKVPPQSWGFRDIGPEYWIATANNVPVKEGDVTMYEGDDIQTQGDHGDVGFWGLFKLDLAAHLWYFGAINTCDGNQGKGLEMDA